MKTANPRDVGVAPERLEHFFRVLEGRRVPLAALDRGGVPFPMEFLEMFNDPALGLTSGLIHETRNIPRRQLLSDLVQASVVE